MELYVVRHAVAFKRDAQRWPDDGERPLTPEGKAEFRRAARGLGHLAPSVDALLSSPLARAWQTAEILAGLEGWPEPKAFPALEPEVPPEDAALALEDYAGAGSVVIVGHRPGLHELTSYLLTGDAEADVRIKKGGALRLSFDGPTGSETAALRWLLTPALLGSCAPPDYS
ncbi:phosphohistidine phosphatase SixA [Rubrobacter marinus]|uniref:Phosphohistidine phosphatase SixA n=1 Tax=Rubrobacter marinus TaxID=2653852 RepID=A0A6G8PUP0_9ACTN|nr:histidine phosphatase family protein [Rubrobacter marinus]QIN77791.1 phosphohistidine phosphatase SixA [Rubrobacter marinus]